MQILHKRLPANGCFIKNLVGNLETENIRDHLQITEKFIRIYMDKNEEIEI